MDEVMTRFYFKPYFKIKFGKTGSKTPMVTPIFGRRAKQNTHMYGPGIYGTQTRLIMVQLSNGSTLIPIVLSGYLISAVIKNNVMHTLVSLEMKFLVATLLTKVFHSLRSI